MSDKILWEADIECVACGGDGLYVGMCERDGAAVICHRCKGTGRQHVKHEYTAFTKRKTNPEIQRVYNAAGGYCISAKDVTTEDSKTENGRTIHFSRAGVSYEEWLEGVKPSPKGNNSPNQTH